MAGKSKRHAARDRAAQASAGRGLAGGLRARDGEAVYSAIRADITQDEGSYSRFLDKDEWARAAAAADERRLILTTGRSAAEPAAEECFLVKSYVKREATTLEIAPIGRGE